jgi:hypothetical protein
MIKERIEKKLSS